jgi:hypothetical protein
MQKFYGGKQNSAQLNENLQVLNNILSLCTECHSFE